MIIDDKRRAGVFYEVHNRSGVTVRITKAEDAAIVVRGHNDVVTRIKTKLRGSKRIISGGDPMLERKGPMGTGRVERL